MSKTTYKAAIMTGPRTIEFQDMPLTEPGHGEVLVKIKAVGICTWEQRFYTKDKQDYFPFWGGHEIAGIVEKIGPGVKNDLKVGDHVAIASLTRCGECYFCRKGMDNQCLFAEAPVESDLPSGPRGFSEYIIARGYECYKVNPELPFAEAAISEPVACCTRSVRQCEVNFGDTVVVQGAGIMGLIHAKLCKLRGAKVVMSEPDAKRREIALQAGADYVVDPLAENLSEYIRTKINPHGAAVVIFTAGGQAAFKQAIETVAIGGRVMLYGSMHPSGIVTFDANDLHYREYRLLGSAKHDKESFREATELLSSGAISIKDLVTTIIPFKKIKEGFELALAGGQYRVVLNMND
jgi:2-desacetyl-2-hydroxyethyl bacteriochlorophyllide A dehydrogenase